MTIKLKHECGIFGIYRGSQSFHLGEALFLGTFSLQHRGQEAAGFAIFDGKSLATYKDLGLVEHVFTQGEIFKHDGVVGISHVRYSTRGRKGNRESAQPFVFYRDSVPIGLVHNGNLTNHRHLRRYLQEQGVTFVSDSDSEALLHLYLRGGNSIEERIQKVYHLARGAYSVLILDGETLIAFRDPWGFRPLVMGQREDTVVFASETSAFDLIKAEVIGEIQPGEAVIVNPLGIRRFQVVPPAEPLYRCVFELIYFSRPDSLTFSEHVYAFRKETGRILAQKETEEIDVVVPVPDSGFPAGMGYAEALGVPLELGLIRSHYLGRSFIEPKQSSRKWAVKLKLLPQREVLDGKRVALIDDSIVRGTTSREIVKRVRQAGAKEVHVRIASPPLVAPCFFGIDIPTKEELIASSRTIPEIAEFLNADSLVYLTVEELLRAARTDGGFCTSCFTGQYPKEAMAYAEEVHRGAGLGERE